MANHSDVACVDEIVNGMEDPGRSADQTSVEVDRLGNSRLSRGLVSFREKKPHFRKRNDAALEGVEQKCLASLRKERLKFWRNKKLKSWPHHFDSAEQCGEEMQKGLMLLWSSYLVVGTLLAAVAIQPLISIRGLQLASPDFEVFGVLWMLALLSDSMGLAVTAVFLAHLLSSPRKLTWIWVCRLGPLRGLPTLILVVDTLFSLLATGYTVWTLYGPAIGLSCLVVEVIGACVYWILRTSQEEKEEPLLQTPQAALTMV